MNRIKDKLSISFWIWALQDMPPGGCYHDFDQRMVELKERGYNCVYCESGAGLAFDLNGHPRGPVGVVEPVPGYGRKIRQQFAVGEPGPCDYLARLLELFRAAKRHDVKIVLTCFYFLHTYWYTEERVNDELFAIPHHEIYHRFAQQLSWIIDALKAEHLETQIAFAEIFNEMDGLYFVGNFGNTSHVSSDERKRFRDDHENALAWLMERHPDITFSVGTYTWAPDPDLVPRNPHVWNFHSYYMWCVYDCVEHGWISSGIGTPEIRFLRPDAPRVDDTLDLRDRLGRRVFNCISWYRRIWYYSNLNPETLPEMDRLLASTLEARQDEVRKRGMDSIHTAIAFRDKTFPNAEIVMTEGVTYCASNDLRWEENSPLYWDIVAEIVRECARLGFRGCVTRTNSGCDEPVWDLTIPQVQRINRIFQETNP